MIDVFQSLKFTFILANNADPDCPDEMLEQRQTTP